MAQPYVGEIRMFAGNFAPAGWMFCEGQLLPISEYETLFNLIGTTYGGDGQSTFALPDLRGRIPLHLGNGVFTFNDQVRFDEASLNVTNFCLQVSGDIAFGVVGAIRPGFGMERGRVGSEGLTWVKDGMVWWAVSDMDPHELRELRTLL